MSVNAEQMFKNLWNQYVQLTPQADKIRQLLEGRGENPLNDHVAFRTIKHPKLGIEGFAKHFRPLGYEAKGEYHFEQKKLYARHMEPTDPQQPQILISELLTDQLSDQAQTYIEDLVQQLPDDATSQPDFCFSGRPWNCTKKVYTDLLQESEYAAWMSAFGFCANHFTILFNSLSSFETLEQLNEFIKASGFNLNSSGGEIKGSADVLLAQSSTMASNKVVHFSDGELEIPSCYYEFARRYEMESGSLYQGFVAASADKIFESTDKNS